MALYRCFTDGAAHLDAVGATLALACTMTLSATAVAAEDVATYMQHHEDGEFVTDRPAGEGREAAIAWCSEPGSSGPRGDEILWHNYLANAIYLSTALSMPAESVVAGTYQNAPKETQLIPLEGTGTPTWTHPGTYWQVAASRNADVIAAVDYNGVDSITIYKWHAGSGTPDWSRIINTASCASRRSVVVSPDGSTIAVLINDLSPDGVPQLYYFDSESATPLGVFDTEGGGARNLSITEDGAYIAFRAGPIVYVMDRDAGTLRYSTSLGASNDAIAISGDGEYIAYGWTSLVVRQWNGTTYTPLFTRESRAVYLRQCAIATDTNTLVVAWYPSTYLQNKVELFDLPSTTPRWTYLYHYGAGAYQDLPSGIGITCDARYVAVSSWGDQANTNPEIEVFSHDSPEPVLTVDTPGSMFDVAIATAPDGSVYLSACGKNVHANQMGKGGDLYSVLVAAGCVADVNSDGVVDIDDLFDVLSHWGEGAGTYDVNDDGTVDIDDIFAVLAAWGPC